MIGHNVIRAATPWITVAAIIAVACGSDSEPSAGGGSGGTSAGGATGGAGSGGTSAGGTSTGGTSSGGSVGVGGTSGSAGTNDGGSTGGSSGSSGTGGNAGTGGGTAVGCRAPTPAASPGNTCKGTAPPALRLTEVTRNLSAPTFITYAPGDTQRLYVLERQGRIRTITNGTLDTAPFLDIDNLVGPAGLAGERGLLGLAFDPNYQQSGKFWVYYTPDSTDGHNTIASFLGTPGQPADASSHGIVLDVPHVDNVIGNHNGGMIAFGSDGCLYVGVGDGGGSGDPQGKGQDTSDALGSILRIDVDQYPQAAPGNMTGTNVYPHLWDYGLRNPWRFSFDRSTGDLYIGDVGQDAWEEVDVEPAGTGQRNYGWDIMEGNHCYAASTCNESGKTRAAAEQANGNTAGSNGAVIGGYVYRGSAIPEMVGRYIYGDHVSRRLWSFTWSGESNGVAQICDTYDLTGLTPAGDITSFGEDAAGEIYLATLNGIIYRIDPG